MPGDDRKALRFKLIKEEVAEVEEAFEEGNLENLAKELIDLLYVIDGCAIECGLQKHVSIFHDSTDRVNDLFQSSKHGVKEIGSVAQNTQAERKRFTENSLFAIDQAFADNDVISLNKALGELIFIVNDYFNVTRLEQDIKKCHEEVHSSNMSKLGADGKPLYREDGKVLKGPNYFQANLSKIIHDQANQIQTS